MTRVSEALDGTTSTQTAYEPATAVPANEPVFQDDWTIELRPQESRRLARSAKRFGIYGYGDTQAVEKATAFVTKGRYVSALKALDYGQSIATTPARQAEFACLIAHVETLRDFDEGVSRLHQDELRLYDDMDGDMWFANDNRHRMQVHEVEVMASAMRLADNIHAERADMGPFIIQVNSNDRAVDYDLLRAVSDKLQNREDSAIAVTRHYLPGYAPTCHLEGCGEHGADH